MSVMIDVRHLTKVFTLHNQGHVSLPVLNDVSFSVNSGECVVLDGASGSGKSTLLRSLYANYLPTRGGILVNHHGQMIDLCQASCEFQLAIRRETIGYVSQFLRVIPRVSTLDVVSQPLLERGVPQDEAKEYAGQMLQRLNVPQRLWSLPPGTFSGGEQQRVNIARGFVAEYPVLLLDEPTASLDRANADIVLELIDEAKQQGCAVVGIFHDRYARDVVADRLFTIKPHEVAA